MLAQLSIRDFAIIDRLEVEFESGFVVVTGETGAGKSILINALHLLLGGRAAEDMIRTGSDKAEVQGVFELAPDSPLLGQLDQLALRDGERLNVRRAIARNGRNRVFVNDRQVNLATLGQLTRSLVDISGQHEHVGLTDEDTHRSLLDAFAGHADLCDKVALAVSDLRRAERDLAALDAQERDRAERQDYLRFALERIDDLDPQANEDDALEAERLRLANAEKLSGGLRRAYRLIYSSENSALDSIGRASKEVSALTGFDPELIPLGEQLEACSRAVEDLGRELSAAGDGLQSDPGRLEEVEQRVHDLRGLMRLHGPDLDSVLARRQDMREELKALETLESRRAELAEGVESTRAQALDVASTLSQARMQVALILAERLQAELVSLAMTGARMEVEVIPNGLAALAEDGYDEVRFLFSANPGEGLLPLARVASGGELSRVLLAIKAVLAEVDPVASYVFDEVDSGVGGAVAEVLGDKLAAVANRHQVICITHLPQIAAQGSCHFSVRKRREGQRTVSAVTRLTSEEERVDELARMAGGRGVSKQARELARTLLSRGD